MQSDYGRMEEDGVTADIVVEDEENVVELKYLLEKLWCDESTYKKKTTSGTRKVPIQNSTVSVFTLEKVYGGFALKGVTHVSPNGEGKITEPAALNCLFLIYVFLTQY
jgi:hypothetical protein